MNRTSGARPEERFECLCLFPVDGFTRPRELVNATVAAVTPPFLKNSLQRCQRPETYQKSRFAEAWRVPPSAGAIQPYQRRCVWSGDRFPWDPDRRPFAFPTEPGPSRPQEFSAIKKVPATSVPRQKPIRKEAYFTAEQPPRIDQPLGVGHQGAQISRSARMPCPLISMVNNCPVQGAAAALARP
jgi:hypothetical protein